MQSLQAQHGKVNCCSTPMAVTDVTAGVNLPGFFDRAKLTWWMSGLDSRYMISQLKPPNVKVLSLTSIATPHRGNGNAPVNRRIR